MARILIIEDESLHAELIQKHLQSIGHTVVNVCRSAEDALLSLSVSLPDMILLDINIDGATDGIELADKIKRHHQIPIVFTTSHTDPAVIERASRTRPEGYLIKPIDQHGLRAAIEVALSKTSSEKPKYELEWESAATSPTQEKSDGHIFIKIGRMLRRVRLEELDFVNASDDKYCDLHMRDGAEYAVRITLTKLCEALPAHFIRTHRGYLINHKNVEGIDESRSMVKLGKKMVPIGKTYKSELYDHLRRIG